MFDRGDVIFGRRQKATDEKLRHVIEEMEVGHGVNSGGNQNSILRGGYCKMKKDLHDQILSEEQLCNVQGGGGINGVNDEVVYTHCLYPQCTWEYSGSMSKAAIAQENHTADTGHDQFE